MALNNPYALNFDGVDDQVGPVTLSNNAYCIELYMYLEKEWTSNSTQMAVFGKGYDNFSIGPTNSWIDGEVISLYSGGSSGYVTCSVYHTIPAGWSHVAFNWNGTTYSIYLNGVKLQTIENKAKLFSVNNLYFGYRGAYGQHFKGKLDEIRLWNKPRTEQELLDNMNKRLKGDESGLILYYRFDEGTGSIAHDSSPSGLNSNITGATWVPGEVDLSDLTPPGQNLLSAYLAGGAYLLSSSIIGKGLSSNLFAGAEMSVGSFARTRGLSAKLKAQATTTSKLTLLASLNANLEGLATIRAGILKLIIPPGTYEITADDYFRKEQPAKSDELVNSIKVYVNPLMPSDAPVEVYKSPLIKIPAGQSVITTIQYNEPPVLEAVATLDSPPDVSITNAVYYAWGAEITITNNGAVDADATLLISGKPLKVLGKQLISVKNEKSIRDNGLLEFEFRDNPLVQTTEMAEKIANNLISFSIPRRDVRVEWRGNPALILADKINVPEYQKGLIDKRGLFYIIKQNIRYDGGLRTTTEGRKIK